MSKRIAVFCSSRAPLKQSWIEAAQQTGQAIAEYDYDLVYGGYDGGLMREVARSTQKHGGKLFGVIPESLLGPDGAAQYIDELFITESMAERKRLLIELADAYLILPGGFGTLEEFFEINTRVRLGEAHGPIVIANIDGCFDHLIALFNAFVQENLTSASSLNAFAIVTDIDDILPTIETFYSDRTIPTIQSER